MARISTHVLDITLGRPAAGVRIELFACPPNRRELIRSVVTNADGRTDEPLLSAATVSAGAYELDFHAGAYIRDASSDTMAPQPVFDVITVRFEVTDSAGSYHIPLLLAPNGYTTYRGS
jgi:5-hydroxyisourate hydrolase